eukprot:m.262641 g.262641  ORF g.262641 m.262641 type:complete len:617 (-) comp19232_c1_seq11:25-1875(-)
MGRLSNKQLMDHSVQLLASHPRAQDAVIDALLQSYCTAANINTSSDQAFLADVFEGCIQNRKLLAATVDAYYGSSSTTCFKSDKPQYTVLAFLALFRLSSMGAPQFGRLVKTQDTAKAHGVLGFLADQEVQEDLQTLWSSLYEPSFVKETLVKPLQAGTRALKDLVETLQVRLGPQARVATPKKPTKPVPFSLTQAAPRTVRAPSPELEAAPKHTKVPATTYTLPIEQEALRRKKEQNRRLREKRLSVPEDQQFSCALRAGQKSLKATSKKNEILAARESAYQYREPSVKPVPASTHSAVPIKLNAAAILREERLLQKQMEQEAKSLAALEAGVDPSAFHEWQIEQHQRAEEERLEEVERKHLLGLITREEAILAKAQVHQEKQAQAADVKQEAARLLAAYKAEKAQAAEANRLAVEAGAQQQQRVRERVEAVAEANAKAKQELVDHNRALRATADAEMRKEQERKMELIRQIRVLESVPVDRTKIVDLSETSGFGFMSEMSYVELQERLNHLKRKDVEVREQRRARINKAKASKQEQLNQKLQLISLDRAERQTSRAAKTSKRASATQRGSMKASNPKLDQLREQLTARREQTGKLKTGTSGSRKGAAPVAGRVR